MLLTKSYAKDELTYPELEVVPLASERLKMEEKKEGLAFYRELQISAAATLLAGIYQIGHYENVNTETSSDPLAPSPDDGWDEKLAENQASPLVGMAVGGGWLAATFLLNKFFTPYSDGLAAIAPYADGEKKGMSRRQILLRERLAEESINRASSFSTRLVWTSVITNAAANIYMASHAREGTAAALIDATAAILAFTPLLFPTRWSIVAGEHQNYKKRIYAPISSSATLLNDGQGGLVPGIMLAFSF